ncbi:unnamed protein product [Cuscuta campestris]|uniref:Large ribosomal subunit protein eL22 n=1 Tax=Cuscuta campestris TaxID=132261 RepID=A0A484MID6_9ASTE|nr:unnamed protein product [Cuscuta campestris]
MLARNFSKALVGRCSSHIHLSEVENFLIKGKFKEFKLRRLQSKELLFIFKHEDDYLRWFSRMRWNIRGSIITICKWTPEHEPTADSPLFPIWVELRNFPIHLNDHKTIFSIASVLGKPIKLDSKSVIGVTPDIIRVCVERDMSIPFPPHIHLRLGAKDLWLPCKFENPPHYCTFCSRFGHNIQACRKKMPENLPGNAPTKEVGHIGADALKNIQHDWKMVSSKRHSKSGKTALMGPSSNHYGVLGPFRYKPIQQQRQDKRNQGKGPESISGLTNTHVQLGEPSKSSKHVGWEDLMPTVEDVTEENISCSPLIPSKSHSRKSILQQAQADLPYDLSFLQVHKPHYCMDIIPYNPFQEDSYPLGVFPQTVELPKLGSKDDCWINDQLQTNWETKSNSSSLLEEPVPYLCHSDGGNDDKPFITSAPIPFELDVDFPQVTSCLFTLQMDNSPILISGVYGAHTVLARKDLWDQLTAMCPSNKRWIVGGDFNAITSPHESKGTCPPNQPSMEDFNSCILNCKLINLDPIGSTFTWSGVRSQGRTWRRLDKVLIHLDLLAFFQDVELHHLAKTNSDHKPILLHCNDQIPNTIKPFRFLNNWTLHENFLNTVKLAWANSPTIGGMRGLLHKLKAVKQALKKWNTETFGNIHSRLREAEARATQSQKAFEDVPNEANRTAAQRDNAALILATNMEVEYWRQKAQIRWLDKGDSNTKLFQAFAKGKRKKLQISHIIDGNGKGLNNMEEIKQEAIKHFQNQFQAPAPHIPDLENILTFIPSLISSEDNMMLTAIPDLAEVKATVWDLDPDSTSGPDGFNGTFFRACWNIIYQDVLTASQEFFLSLPIPKGYGSTLITLIPKKDDPKRFDDFRLISLSTFLSKINTKLLANRIKKLLPKLISPEQGAFQKGKTIDDHILLAQEAIHGLDRKVFGGNLIIKIDMAKAFDCMNWSFLEGTLRAFGFTHDAINLLMANLRSTFISILINGEPHGFFSMTRGVKQGDPLSPLLFIVGFEAFFRFLNHSMDNNTIKRFNMGSVKMPSHLIYADDLMIFTKGDILNLLKLNHILKVFMQASGQQINFSKSRFYTPKSTTADQHAKMEKALSMKCGSLPFTYLGAILRRGILKKEDCDSILNHIYKHLYSWYSRTLNQMGRLILIKHVLSSIPLHLIAVHSLPRSIIKTIHSLMANFLWGQKNGKAKYHWRNWNFICQNQNAGGLGIRDLLHIEKAYSIKLWWKAQHDQSLWAKLVRAKYMKNGCIKERLPDSPTWKRICRIHSLGAPHMQWNNGQAIWDNGQFSLKQAFRATGEELPALLSTKFIWHKAQIPKLRFFQWKIFNNCLPFPTNLRRPSVRHHHISFGSSSSASITAARFVQVRRVEMSRGSTGVVKGGKKKGVTFIIDCSKPVEDKIMDIASLEKFLQERIKVGGKPGALGDSVTVTREKTKITVTSDSNFSKRYLKYLTKKYLKKNSVRDWLRVISSNKDKSVYELRYFNIAENETEDED